MSTPRVRCDICDAEIDTDPDASDEAHSGDLDTDPYGTYCYRCCPVCHPAERAA